MPQSAILPGIDHVIVLMLENRSFDSMAGWLYGDSQPLNYVPAAYRARYEGLYPAELVKWAQPFQFPGGSTQNYPLKRGASTNVLDSVAYLNSPPVDPNEEWEYVTNQIYGPLPLPPPVDPPAGAQPNMKGFLHDYANRWKSSEQDANKATILQILETYTPQQLPVLSELALRYAISDAWFSSAPTQTNPNRAFMACGTSQDPLNNGSGGYSAFTAPTIWNRFTELGASWTIFWEGKFTPISPDNKCWTRKAFTQLPDDESKFLNMAAFHRMVRTGTLPAFSFIEPSWTLEAQVGQLRGFQGDECHPPGDMRPAENLLSQIYTSLLANYAAFTRTLWVITFDEHGGTFDHVPPPSAQPPVLTPSSHFNRYGVRVPTVFVSPRILPSTVIRGNTDLKQTPQFDHTSIPATLLSWQGVDRKDYGLGLRALMAPTFDGVINAPAARPAEEMILGPQRTDQPAQASSVRLGDRLFLRHVSPGKYDGMYINPSVHLS